MDCFLLFAGALLLFLCRLWWYIRVPRHMPRDLPRIPIYATLHAIFYGLDYIEFYELWMREPLEKHGAVIHWFGDHWNIIVADPELISDVLRHDKTYIKAGLRLKVSKSVIGNLLGENIISVQHNHRLHASVVKPGIVKKFDPIPLQKKASLLATKLIEAQTQSDYKNADVLNWMEKYALDGLLINLFGRDRQILERPHVPIRELISAMKQTMFRRTFLAFPALDSFWWIIPGRWRAFRLLAAYDDLVHNIARETRAEKLPHLPDILSDRLIQARDSNTFNEWQLRSTLRTIVMVGHDNIQYLLTSAMFLLGTNIAAQERLRAEVLEKAKGDIDYDTLDNLPCVLSTIHEVLRLWPPLGDFANRVAISPEMIGGKVHIPAGTYVGWHAYGVQTSRHVWGPTAREFRPERWGSTTEQINAKVRHENLRGAYIPFNAYARKCLGQSLALLEARIALIELVKRVQWTIDPNHQIKISSGPNLFPLNMKINIRDLKASK